jgi:hypothetical protein
VSPDRAAFHLNRTRMLILALETQLALDVPLPPRRVDSREATLLTSLRVARAEVDHALEALTCKPSHTTRRFSNV